MILFCVPWTVLVVETRWRYKKIKQTRFGGLKKGSNQFFYTIKTLLLLLPFSGCSDYDVRLASRPLRQIKRHSLKTTSFSPF